MFLSRYQRFLLGRLNFSKKPTENRKSKEIFGSVRRNHCTKVRFVINIIKKVVFPPSQSHSNFQYQLPLLAPIQVRFEIRIGTSSQNCGSLYQGNRVTSSLYFASPTLDNFLHRSLTKFKHTFNFIGENSCSKSHMARGSKVADAVSQIS